MSSPQSILVVDDDADLLFVVALLLTREGYVVQTLPDCTKLFDLLRGKPAPDLIIMDINLGSCDDRELCIQLKQQPAFRHIPVALYSSDRLDMTICNDALANGFIQKPFSFEVLTGKVRDMLMA